MHADPRVACAHARAGTRARNIVQPLDIASPLYYPEIKTRAITRDNDDKYIS